VRVATDRDRCIGAAVCVHLAPAVFDLDPDHGLVVLLDESPSETQRPVVEQAVESCPAAVVRLLP